jgi:hypothetical protein
VTLEITDEYMNEMLGQAKDYSFVLLQKTSAFGTDSRPTIWEHGRRNFSLRAQGTLAIVCPITDDSPLAGVYIFNVSPDEARRIMSEDPGVQAGLFTFDVHPCRGFPGDALSP